MQLSVQGVRNLINNCAEVKRGESVLLINELGRMESELVTVIAAVQRKASQRGKPAQ